MKHLLLLCIAIIVSVTSAVAQNITITQNGENVVKQGDNQYYINGISTRENIGGVDVGPQSVGNGYYKLIFTNYNNFAVNVDYEVNGNSGSIVLKPLEKDKTSITRYGFRPDDIIIIVREMSAMAQPAKKAFVLYGYFKVYPEDLGEFDAYQKFEPIINGINQQGLYGSNKWRLPTVDELSILNNNYELLGLYVTQWNGYNPSNGHYDKFTNNKPSNFYWRNDGAEIKTGIYYHYDEDLRYQEPAFGTRVRLVATE